MGRFAWSYREMQPAETRLKTLSPVWERAEPLIDGVAVTMRFLAKRADGRAPGFPGLLAADQPLDLLIKPVQMY